MSKKSWVEKLGKCMREHPIIMVGLYLAMLLFLLVLAEQMRRIGIIDVFLCTISIIALVIAVACVFLGKRHKENLDKRAKQDVIEKHKQFVTLVEEQAKRLEIAVPDHEWVARFDAGLNVTSDEIMYRYFNDFDIASVLMFSLTRKELNDETVLLGFECAKQILANPVQYKRRKDISGELFLVSDKKEETIRSRKLDETIPESIVLSTIKFYLSKLESPHDVISLSDFLRVMYLEV